MKFDLTVTISVLVALSAVISPIFVAIINNRYQTKLRCLEVERELALKELETFYCDKKKVFDEFLIAAGQYASYTTNSLPFTIMRDLPSKAYSAILFCNPNNKQLILDFLEFAISLYKTNRDGETISSYNIRLFEVSSALNDELCNLISNIEQISKEKLELK